MTVLTIEILTIAGPLLAALILQYPWQIARHLKVPVITFNNGHRVSHEHRIKRLPIKLVLPLQIDIHDCSVAIFFSYIHQLNLVGIEHWNCPHF